MVGNKSIIAEMFSCNGARSPLRLRVCQKRIFASEPFRSLSSFCIKRSLVRAAWICCLDAYSFNQLAIPKLGVIAALMTLPISLLVVMKLSPLKSSLTPHRLCQACTTQKVRGPNSLTQIGGGLQKGISLSFRISHPKIEPSQHFLQLIKLSRAVCYAGLACAFPQLFTSSLQMSPTHYG